MISRIAILALGTALGFLLQDYVYSRQSLESCVFIEGEKGVNGGGDGSPGVFCRNGFVILPGRGARGTRGAPG